MNESTPSTIIAIACGVLCLLPVLTLFVGIWIGRTRVSLTIEPRHRPDQPQAAADARYAIRQEQK